MTYEKAQRIIAEETAKLKARGAVNIRFVAKYVDEDHGYVPEGSYDLHDNDPIWGPIVNELGHNR